jgi:hypothetical protein
MCNVGSRQVLLKPATVSLFLLTGKNCLRMTCTYFSQLIVSLKPQVQHSFLHLEHTRHQLSLDGAGLCRLDVDSENSSSNYFVYLCIPAREPMLLRKEYQLRIDLTFDDWS